MTGHASSETRTILMIDDHQDADTLLHYVLEHGGFDVVTAKSGEELTRVLRRGEPSTIVLMDLSRPDENGLDLVTEIRATPRWQNTPIAIVTSNKTEEHMMWASQIRAVDYLVKPLSPLALLAKLRRLLGLPALNRTPG